MKRLNEYVNYVHGCIDSGVNIMKHPDWLLQKTQNEDKIKKARVINPVNGHKLERFKSLFVVGLKYDYRAIGYNLSDGRCRVRTIISGWSDWQTSNNLEIIAVYDKGFVIKKRWATMFVKWPKARYISEIKDNLIKIRDYPIETYITLHASNNSK